jgi:hypothetical protein
MDKNSIEKVNFRYAAFEDVYFDELISHLLGQYGFVLFYYLNNILLNQEIYNEKYNNDKPLEEDLIDVLRQYVKVKNQKSFKNIDYKNAMDNVITNIDKAFVEAAPRYEKAYIHKFFYRGMNRKYINTNGNELENIGDTALILNYTSVTSDYEVSKEFALGKFARGKDPTIYKIYLSEGLPFINMVSTARWLREKEFLLPRNIIFELIDKKGNEYTVLAKPFKKDQFYIKTGCIPLNFYDIVPSTISYIQSPKKLSIQSTPSQSKVKSKSKSPKVLPVKKDIKPKPIAKQNVKLGRCPNGTRRNPKTLLCEPKLKVNSKSSSSENKKKVIRVLPVKKDIKPKSKPIAKQNVKLGRCPNGTRRNPKTLLCEPKH